jgi:hypothetical protein
MRNFHAILALVSIEKQIEAASAHARQLTHDNILRDATHRIDFGVTCSIHQDVNGFLKGTSHESTRVLTIDAVTCDGHQVSLCCHDIAK